MLIRAGDPGRRFDAEARCDAGAAQAANPAREAPNRWLEPTLSPHSLYKVGQRRRISRLLFWPVYAAFWLALRIVGGYRIENLRAIRGQFAALASRSSPILICANHLTFVDSLLIVWALAPARFYARRYNHLSWNVPADDVFGRRWLCRAILRVTKCIPIDRNGSMRHKDRVLQLCAHLLAKGETVTIFPEGRRSRSGRFDPGRLATGVGKVVAHAGPCRVACVYMRAEGQDGYSDFPRRGSRFRLAMEVIEFGAVLPRPGAYRAITACIGETLARLEKRHFGQPADWEDR